ncbi:MAG: VanZ family protein [Lamprobacter sp.]|uniref:VanZ family protein n=1 Tax=Lamprobacter sp. TaxID=3100796 RepID=UPI002B25F2F5|nr:VanZ family protein [Lamprobacter sp.]MEA3639008.1 VanZ family protein [Lamprobacter sp.]
MRDLEFLKTARAQEVIQRLSQAALWSCVLVVAYLAFLPSADPIGASWDKANHLLAFAVMAWLADLGWPARRQASLRWGLLLGYGLLIETVQHFIPLRHFSLLDWVADGIGILIYLGLKARWQGYQRSSALKH